MEIKIPKEVRDYHENIFFGLNTVSYLQSLTNNVCTAKQIQGDRFTDSTAIHIDSTRC